MFPWALEGFLKQGSQANRHFVGKLRSSLLLGGSQCGINSVAQGSRLPVRQTPRPQRLQSGVTPLTLPATPRHGSSPEQVAWGVP